MAITYILYMYIVQSDTLCPLTSITEVSSSEPNGQNFLNLKVAPAELEALLLQHKEVADAGVIGLPNEEAGELPMAFVVPQPGSKVTEKDLVEFVASRVTSTILAFYLMYHLVKHMLLYILLFYIFLYIYFNVIIILVICSYRYHLPSGDPFDLPLVI